MGQAHLRDIRRRDREPLFPRMAATGGKACTVSPIVSICKASVLSFSSTSAHLRSRFCIETAAEWFFRGPHFPVMLGRPTSQCRWTPQFSRSACEANPRILAKFDDGLSGRLSSTAQRFKVIVAVDAAPVSSHVAGGDAFPSFTDGSRLQTRSLPSSATNADGPFSPGSATTPSSSASAIPALAKRGKADGS